MIKHWIQAFADGGDATFGKFIQKAHKIGEITEFQGNFTNDLIIKHVKDAELFRNDCPLNNYSIMLKLETEKFREINRFISPGGIFNRIYPSKSLDLVYCFQAMNSSSKLISAPDHILATLTQDPL